MVDNYNYINYLFETKLLITFFIKKHIHTKNALLITFLEVDYNFNIEFSTTFPQIVDIIMLSLYLFYFFHNNYGNCVYILMKALYFVVDGNFYSTYNRVRCFPVIRYFQYFVYNLRRKAIL